MSDLSKQMQRNHTAKNYQKVQVKIATTKIKL